MVVEQDGGEEEGEKGLAAISLPARLLKGLPARVPWLFVPPFRDDECGASVLASDAAAAAAVACSSCNSASNRDSCCYVRLISEM